MCIILLCQIINTDSYNLIKLTNIYVCYTKQEILQFTKKI